MGFTAHACHAHTHGRFAQLASLRFAEVGCTDPDRTATSLVADLTTPTPIRTMPTTTTEVDSTTPTPAGSVSTTVDDAEKERDVGADTP